MRLKGEGFSLRPLEISDAESMQRNANHPSVLEKWLTRNIDTYTVEDAKKFIGIAGDDRASDKRKIMGIEVDGNIIGTTSLTRNHWPYDRTAYVSCWIGPDFRGQGLATKAISLLVEHTQELLPDLIRVEARIFELNEPLQKILPKAGFTFEARHPNRAFYQGEIQDELFYAIYL